MNILLSTFYFLPSRKGQTALSLVFLIGIVIVSIGATIAFLSSSFLSSGYGFQAANRALAIATAGVEDGLVKLIRNKDFSAGTPYSVPVDNDSATVTVTQNSPVAGQATIISSGTALFRQRKIQVIVAINSTTSEVSVISWQLLTL